MFIPWLTIFLSVVYSQKLNIQPFLVGGIETPSKPWMVYLTNYQISCGGTLYNQNSVITVAHCKVGNIKDWRAHLNRYNITKLDHEEGGSSHKILSRVNHPKYKPNLDNKFDVSVWWIDNDNNYQTMVELDDGTEASNKNLNVFAIGWGKTRKVKPGEENLESSGLPSQLLMRGELPLIDEQRCANRYTFLFDPQLMLCTGGDTIVATCQGDSGGPIYREIDHQRIILMDITSASVGCGFEDYYDLSTRVSHPTIIEFINKQSNKFRLKGIINDIYSKRT